MSDLFIVNFDDDDGDDRRARQEAERWRIRTRYKQHLVQTVDIDESTAERVISLLFDPVDREGSRCPCSCHPSLSALHDDGLDCNCSWDEDRRAEKKRAFSEILESDAVSALRVQHAVEEDAIVDWVSGQPNVEAKRTTAYVPEQWEGSVEGHSFYFRERGGLWRIELDLEPSGSFANRVADVREDGELVTEPVPIMEGEVIAEGVESQLGDSAIAHIDFIIRTIRDHLWARECDHSGALFFCAKCGERMGGPT